MADISIEEAKAKMWIDDVTAELNAVESILIKVNQSLSTVAGDEDTIMEGIVKIGNKMEEVWTEMCKKFKEIQDKLPGIVDMIKKAAQKVIDEANEVKNKIS